MTQAFNWLVANWTFNVAHWWVWVIVTLCAWRWASMLVMEDGPFGVFYYVRALRGVKDLGGMRQGPAFTAFMCIKCMSVWMAFVWLALPWQVALVFAVSAAAIWFNART